MAALSYNFVPKPKLPQFCYERYDYLPKEYKLLKTPLLMSAKEKGCLKGWHYFAKLNEPSEDVWVTIQFLSALVLFGFSAGFLIRGLKSGYDYARFTISMGFLLYATVDSVTRMIFRLASYCTYVNSEDYVDPEAANDRNPVATNDSDTEAAKVDNTTKVDNSTKVNNTTIGELTQTRVSGATGDWHPERVIAIRIDDDITPAPRNVLKNDNTSTKKDDTSTQKDSASMEREYRDKIRLDYESECRGRCLSFSSKTRFILTDIFLYPMFVCNLPKYAGASSLDDLDFNYRKYEGAYILVFCSVYVLLAYLTRILVVSFSLWSIAQLLLSQEEKKKWKITCKVCCYKNCTLSGVLVHTVCQFIFQAMVMVILWLIANRDFSPSIQVTSGIFWLLAVVGYFCPSFGILSFFITDYYNTEDLLVTLLERSAEMETSGYHQALVEEHSDVTTKPYLCLFRTFYSFFSFPLICMAITYTVFFLIFVTFCFAAAAAVELATGWVVFLIFFMALGFLINLRVF